ncbi:unnamed protein product, partial [Porites lobata]
MLEQDDPPSFLAAYFNEPDHSGHKFGPNSPEIKSVIRRMDNVTGYLFKSLRNSGLLNEVRITKANFRLRNTCSKKSYLMRMTKYLPLLETCAQWLTDNCRLHKTTVEEKLVSRENKVFNLTFPKCLMIIVSSEISKEMDVKTVNVIVKKQINNNLFFILSTVMDHGNDNKIFKTLHNDNVAQGPAFKEGFVSEPFKNVTIYSLMCHLLGIEPAPKNGSLQAVQHLLKEHKHNYTVLIVVSVISVLVLLLMSYGIVSFCVKNHCRIRQYGHIYDLGTSELL